MSEGELAQRFIASQASVKGDDLRKGKVPPARWGKIVGRVQPAARSRRCSSTTRPTCRCSTWRAKTRRLAQQQADGARARADRLPAADAVDQPVRRHASSGGADLRRARRWRRLAVPLSRCRRLSPRVEQRPGERPDALRPPPSRVPMGGRATTAMSPTATSCYDDDFEDAARPSCHIAERRNSGLGTVQLVLRRVPALHVLRARSACW